MEGDCDWWNENYLQVWSQPLATESEENHKHITHNIWPVAKDPSPEPPTMKQVCLALIHDIRRYYRLPHIHKKQNGESSFDSAETYFGVGVTVHSFTTPSTSALTTVDPVELNRQWHTGARCSTYSSCSNRHSTQKVVQYAAVSPVTMHHKEIRPLPVEHVLRAHVAYWFLMWAPSPCVFGNLQSFNQCTQCLIYTLNDPDYSLQPDTCTESISLLCDKHCNAASWPKLLARLTADITETVEYYQVSCDTVQLGRRTLLACLAYSASKMGNCSNCSTVQLSAAWLILQARWVQYIPQGCEMLRILHCLDSLLTEGVGVVSLTHQLHYTTGRFLVLICGRGWVNPRALVGMEGLDKLEKSSHIGNQTHDLTTCSIVPQPTTLLHTPISFRTLTYTTRLCKQRETQWFWDAIILIKVILIEKHLQRPYLFRFLA
jgi:hypothetical protein